MADISWPTITYLLGGVGLTAVLILSAMLIGLVMGTVMASIQVYGPAWSGKMVSLYVWFFRGVPILVLMFLFHFGLIGLLEEFLSRFMDSRPRLPALVSAISVLGLCSTAYQSQIFRGAMQSIPAGQFKAAKALGMSGPQAVRVIILPQVFRISIPAWSNEYSILLKDSAIAFVIGVAETMSRFKAVATTTHRHLFMYILAGLLYFILTWIGVKLLAALYDKIRTPGLAASGGENK